MTPIHNPAAPTTRARATASTPGPRSAGRPRSPAVSRGRIADAVADLICEHGLKGWSMRDLARCLGVSTGTITHYFPDKQALLIGAMDSVYVLPTDWPEYQAQPLPLQLRRMTEMFVLDDERKRRWGRFWLAYLAGAGHDATLRSYQVERYERQRRFFTRLITIGIEAGAYATNLDAQDEAVRLLALGNGLAMQQVATPEGLTPDAARAILDAYLAGLQGGIDTRAGAV